MSWFAVFRIRLGKHSTYLGLFLAVVIWNFRQMKPFFNCFFIFFRIEFLLRPPKKLIAYPLIGSKSEKPQECFVTASQQTVLALMSIFHIPILADAAALT
jgi:hypothetical protein